MDIYMTVGYGSFGKSTYCRKHFKDEDIISMDKLVGRDSGPTTEYYDQYLQLITTRMNERYPIIVLDYAHDNVSARNEVLRVMPSRDLYNLHLLVFYPPFDIWMKFHSTRQSRIFTVEEISNFKYLYDHYKIPLYDEFVSYGFKSVSIHVLEITGRGS